jgi:hypothetical protein
MIQYLNNQKNIFPAFEKQDVPNSAEEILSSES